MERTDKTKRLALLSMFAAIILMLAFTPIGFIQLVFIKATIVHVPVIIGSIILGPKAGAALGFLFGLTSFISNTITPAILSFVFSPLIPVPGTDQGSLLALVICFIPRILVGVVPWYTYRLLTKLMKGKGTMFSLAVAGVSGSLTNTLLVMNLIYFLFQDTYAAARGVPVKTVYQAVLAVIFTNGIPEALVAGFITMAVCKALLSFLKTRTLQVENIPPDTAAEQNSVNKKNEP
ncbi:MAG TPA: ECF transporter S component [Oscillospiraceae bacterium]|nr:ECF transporter S component [Oscillospiraceae bacterium]